MGGGTKRKNSDSRPCNFHLNGDDSCKYNGRYYEYVGDLIDFLQKRADHLQEIVDNMRTLVDGKGRRIANPQKFIDTTLKALDEQRELANNPNGPFARSVWHTKQKIIDASETELDKRKKALDCKDERIGNQQDIMDDQSDVIDGLKSALRRKEKRVENQEKIIDENDCLIKKLKKKIELLPELQCNEDESRHKVSKISKTHNDVHMELEGDKIIKIQELEMQIKAQKGMIKKYQKKLKEAKESYQRGLDNSGEINESLKDQVETLKHKLRESKKKEKRLNLRCNALEQKLDERTKKAINRMNELHEENEELNEDLKGTKHNIGLHARKSFGVGRKKGEEKKEKESESVIGFLANQASGWRKESDNQRKVAPQTGQPIPIFITPNAEVPTLIQDLNAVRASIYNMSEEKRNELLLTTFSTEELSRAASGGILIGDITHYLCLEGVFYNQIPQSKLQGVKPAIEAIGCPETETPDSGLGSSIPG